MHDAISELEGNSIVKPATILLLTVLVVAYAALQLYTIPAAKECIFGQLAADHTGIKSIAGCFKVQTLWPALLIVQVVLLLTVIEAFYKGVSKLAESVLGNDKKTALVVAAAVAILTLFYVAKGDVFLGDAYLFQPAAEIFKSAMSEGVPHHTFYWYGGSSHFEYYGQVYFAVVAVADTIFGNINFTIKIVNWLLHIIAAVALYFFVLELTKSRKAGFVSAIAYSVSYEHITRIMLHGRLTNSLIYLLLPLLLLLLERHIKGRISAQTAIAGASLTAAAIFLTNPGDGIFVLMPAAAYFAARAVQLPQKRANIIKTAVIASVFFCILTSAWAVPFLLEKSAFNAGARVAELASIKFNPELLKEMASFPGQRTIVPVFYLGIIQILLAGVAGFVVIKQSKKNALAALTLAAAITLILVLFQSTRYVPALVLALAIMAGVGSGIISQKIARLAKFVTMGQLFILFAAIIILDSGASLIQPDYTDFSHEKKIIADKIQAGQGFRSIDLHSDRRTFYPSLTYLATRTESVFGPLLEGAPKSANYALAIATRAAKEYYDDNTSFSNRTLDGLYLFNVKYAVLHPEQIGSKGRNLKATFGLEQQIDVMQLQNSPVIAAPQIEQSIDYNNNELEKEENYFLRPSFEARQINYGITDEITQRMGINRQKATADKILVKNAKDAEADAAAAAGNEIGNDSEVLEIKSSVLETKHSMVRIKVEQGGDAFLQLSYSASPEISVFIDGRKAEYYTTAVGTIAVKTGKGEHAIDIVARPSKLRQILFVISAVVAAAMAAILVSKLFGRHKIFKLT